MFFLVNFDLQSKREAMMFYPTDPSEKLGLFALRLGKYKAHFFTRGELHESSLQRKYLTQAPQYEPQTPNVCTYKPKLFKCILCFRQPHFKATVEKT